MTTRRQVLMGVAGAGLLAACESPTGTPVKKIESTLLARHTHGVGVLDAGAGEWLVPPAPAAMPVDRGGLATVEAGQLAIWRLPERRRATAVDLEGEWTPAAMVRDRVALVHGAERRRTATTIMIAGTDRRLDLPGNIEPEAFSPDGERLYVLDHVPPGAPEVYRVRVLDLATGEMFPLSTKDKQPVPPEAEETMRGEGGHAVYDASRGILFTLYTHQAGHQHTGELLGVRPGSPDVHAFIHALHLAEGWAYCIDLPAPFGTSAAPGHTLALGDDLCAITAADGVLARIDRTELTVRSTKTFPAMAGAASAVATVDGRVVIGAGTRLTDTESQWTLPHSLSGLASGPGGLLWTAFPDLVVALDAADRRPVHEIAVPGLRSVIGVVR